MRVVALLRSVNVGGRRLKMADLRAMADKAGCRDVSTLLATGNVVMAPPDDPVGLHERFEQVLATDYGETAVVLRTHEQLQAAVAANPFAPDVDDGIREGRFVHTFFLQSAPTDEALAALVPPDCDDELVVDGLHAFMAYAGSTHDSPLSGAWLERHLGVTGTARNHNTVRKLISATGPG